MKVRRHYTRRIVLAAVLKVVGIAVGQRKPVAAKVGAFGGDLGVLIAEILVVDPGDVIIVLF